MSQKRQRSPSLNARWKYALDNFMAKGGLSVFLALLSMFAVGFVAMGVFRLLGGVIWHDDTAPQFADMLWRTFIEIADPGNIGADDDAPYLSKAIGVGTIFVGMILFSSMVAFMTSQFEAKLESLRRGRSQVIESNHSLILGFGDRVMDIVRELIIANESEKKAAVVVLADKDKQEMDDIFNERIPNRKTTRIITRSGLPANIEALHKVGAARARSITILSEASSGDSEEQKALAEAHVLKAIMAVVAAVGEENLPPIVAELHEEKNRQLAESILPGRITTLATGSLLAKMLVQTSRVSGLAIVYSDLVGFEGNEVYFFRPSTGWPQLTFGQLQYHFHKSVALGVRQGNGALSINPPHHYVLRADDDAIVLAEDDSAIRFSPTPVFSPRPLQIPGTRQTLQAERQLLVGWTSKSLLIIDEYAQYLAPGSAIHIVVEEVTDELRGEVEAVKQKYPNIDIALAELDITTPNVLSQIVPHTYQNVIILSRDSDTPEEADAATIALLLRFRQYFKLYERTTGQVATTQLITEVMDSENTELVLKVGVKDFLISNQFVSKIFAQVGQEPDVKRIYEELFREEGSEIYLKPVELFFPQLPVTLSFGDCVAAAQLRSEVCLGYRMAAEEQQAGHGIHLIPMKNQSVVLNPGDCLITLAEDET